MSREEDLIRSTARAIASTVREVPPLRLDPEADDLPSPARSPRRRRAGGRRRRWATWGAPLTAAALVVALAVTLVTIRSMNNDGVAPPNTTSSPDPGAVPRYYVALTTFSGTYDTAQQGIVVGDSVTGQRIAKLAPPARTTFQSVTAAADDRTFVVLAVTSPDGTFGVAADQATRTMTGRWYEVKLDPGAAQPARLTPLPVKPWSWTASSYATTGAVFAAALSPDGQELAVADVPPVPASDLKMAPDWQEVKVFSVATGRLLHDWTERDHFSAFSDIDWTKPTLTWIDGGQALVLTTGNDVPAANTITGTMRRLNVATGPASGDLAADSHILWTGKIVGKAPQGCYSANSWPPLISADGKTVTCATSSEGTADPSRETASIVTDPLPGGAGIKPRSVYQVPPLPTESAPDDISVMWVSSSGDTLIAQWHFAQTRYAGVISHGTLTPLRLPANLAVAQPGQIAF